MDDKKTTTKAKPKPKLPANTYLIGKVKLTMKPMKIRQIKEFVKLLGALDVGDGTDLTFSKLTDLAFNEKLPQIASIIFGGEAKNIDWDDVDYEVLEVMIKDFLLLNPSLILRLKELAANFSLKV